MIKDDNIPWVRMILALFVLRILRDGPAYGNKIAEVVKKRTNHVITPNTNALYPLLRVMEERGYIIGKWDDPDRRCKRIYSITDLGVSYTPILEDKARKRFVEMEENIAILRKNLFESESEKNGK